MCRSVPSGATTAAAAAADSAEDVFILLNTMERVDLFLKWEQQSPSSPPPPQSAPSSYDYTSTQGGSQADSEVPTEETSSATTTNRPRPLLNPDPPVRQIDVRFTGRAQCFLVEFCYKSVQVSKIEN